MQGSNSVQIVEARAAGKPVAFKSILLGLAPAETGQAAIQYALSLGSTLGAHVSACSYALSPDLPNTAVLSWMRDNVVQGHATAVKEQAAAAVNRFRNEAKKFKVGITTQVLRASLNRAVVSFGEEARLHDVTIVTQSERGIDHAGDLFAEASLFYSGRPLILVPRDHSAGFCADRVLVAWDGSQHATRAVAQAMPILYLAKKVEVLVVGSKEKVERTHAAKIVKNLERHDLDVELICRDEPDEVDTIVREAEVGQASMLVMGGYGHSRAREIFFGGVTRYMMSETQLPVLMAH
jgi:nucleotide-binding universal stress UspA family protein